MRTTMIILAAVVLVLGTVAMAQPGTGGRMNCDHPGAKGMHQGPGHARGAGGMMGVTGGRPGVQHLMRLADELELTEQQQGELKGMLVKFQTERIDKEAALEKARVNLQALVTDDKASDANVMKAIDDVSAKEADLMKMRYQHHKAAMAVLTDAQQAEMKEFRQERWRGRWNGDDDDDEDDDDARRPGMGMHRGMGR